MGDCTVTGDASGLPHFSWFLFSLALVYGILSSKYSTRWPVVSLICVCVCVVVCALQRVRRQSPSGLCLLFYLPSTTCFAWLCAHTQTLTHTGGMHTHSHTSVRDSWSGGSAQFGPDLRLKEQRGWSTALSAPLIALIYFLSPRWRRERKVASAHFRWASVHEKKRPETKGGKNNGWRRKGGGWAF